MIKMTLEDLMRKLAERAEHGPDCNCGDEGEHMDEAEMLKMANDMRDLLYKGASPGKGREKVLEYFTKHPGHSFWYTEFLTVELQMISLAMARLASINEGK